MSKHLVPRQNKGAVALFATVVVLFLGLCGCLIIYLGSGGNDWRAIAGMLAIFVNLLGLAFACRDRPESSQKTRWSWLRRRKTAKTSLELKTHAPRASEYGTNKPPTAEEVHEAKDETRTWVPTRI